MIICEDEPIQQKLYKKLAELLGMKVYILDSGVGIIELLHTLRLENIKIDMILTDSCMPDVSGLDVIYLVKDSIYKDIDIVIHSSTLKVTDQRIFINAGASYVGTKPLSRFTMDVYIKNFTK